MKTEVEVSLGIQIVGDYSIETTIIEIPEHGFSYPWSRVFYGSEIVTELDAHEAVQWALWHSSYRYRARCIAVRRLAAGMRKMHTGWMAIWNPVRRFYADVVETFERPWHRL